MAKPTLLYPPSALELHPPNSLLPPAAPLFSARHHHRSTTEGIVIRSARGGGTRESSSGGSAAAEVVTTTTAAASAWAGGTGEKGGINSTSIIFHPGSPAASPTIASITSTPVLLPNLTLTRDLVTSHVTRRDSINGVLEVLFHVNVGGRNFEVSIVVTNTLPHAVRPRNPTLTSTLACLKSTPRPHVVSTLPLHAVLPLPIVTMHQHRRRARATAGRLGCDSTTGAAAVPGRAGGAHGIAAAAMQGG